MRLQKIVRLILCAALLLQSTLAFETDQYNLPSAPLADIGGEVSEYVQKNLIEAVDKTNAEILRRQSCLENKTREKKCDSPEKERRRIEYLQTEDAIALAVFKLLGAGTIPYTKSGSWMESHTFKNQPARYKTGFRKSIFLIFPTDYLSISSTVNLYGTKFGTDKIAHIFQQGFDYYKIYNRALREKSTPAEATRKAVRWGRRTENTYFGTLISGVFSNGDMYANFAGLKFYIGLTREIKIGDETRPAILRLENGAWTFNDNGALSENLLKPFISNHLNEALNPSIFIPGLRAYVRRTVRKQSCADWRKRFPERTRDDFGNISNELKLWNGEDYGFKDSKKFVTIANTCFGNEAPKNQQTRTSGAAL